MHRRVSELARERGQSLSSMITELTTHGLSQLGEPVPVATDPRSGFPVVRVGRSITSQDVAEALDDE